MNIQRQDHSLLWVIRICNNNRVGLIVQVKSKKLRNFIDGIVIQTGLHRKNKVMIQVGNIYCLVNNQVVCFPRNWIVISDTLLTV